MLRLLCLLFLSWLCVEGVAQSVPVKKSSDIVVIRGKSYYLHTVLAGQTLYSICKAYGVTVEELKSLNDKKDNNLSLYEVLKVPYVEEFVQQDDEFYYHKVARGETMYSIARVYGVKPRRLLKLNPEYSNKQPLSVGAVVKLPLDEINPSVLKDLAAQSPVQEHKQAEPVNVVTKQPDMLDSPKEKVERKDKNDRRENPEIQTNFADTLKNSHVKGWVWQDVHREIPEYLSEVVMPSNPFVKIALLLPFSAKDFPLYRDSLEHVSPVKIPARVEQFVVFYEGVLLAVDSLKKAGYQIDLHVYDTERSAEKMYEMARLLDRLHPDLIIGPVYASEYKVLAENLSNKNIPLVYPLSSRYEDFGQYPNFVQVNSSFEVLVDRMVRWVKTQQPAAHVLNIRTGGEGNDDEERSILQKYLSTVQNMKVFMWGVDGNLQDSLRSKLMPDRENILLLPLSKEAEVSKILPSLSALTDDFKITLVGLPEWQTFTSIDHSAYYKLNTKIFTYSYVDYTTAEARHFSEQFRKYFYTEPGTLAFKAFDMGLYFIELAAKYRDRTLEALRYYDDRKAFSLFRFRKNTFGQGLENTSFFIVNYASDYSLKIEIPEE